MVGLWKFGQTRGDYSEYCPDIQGHSLSNPQSRTYSKSIGITPSKKVIQASKKKGDIFWNCTTRISTKEALCSHRKLWSVSTNSHSSWKVKMQWRQSTLHQNQSRYYRRGLRKVKDEECHECYRPYSISWLSMNVHKDTMNLFCYKYYAWLEFVTPSAWFQHFQNSGPQHPNCWWVVANWLLDGSNWLQNRILST